MDVYRSKCAWSCLHVSAGELNRSYMCSLCASAYIKKAAHLVGERDGGHGGEKGSRDECRRQGSIVRGQWPDAVRLQANISIGEGAKARVAHQIVVPGAQQVCCAHIVDLSPYPHACPP